MKKIKLLVLIPFILSFFLACNSENSADQAAINPLDYRKFEDAAAGSNIELCKEIENEKLKEECTNSVLSANLLNEAIKNNDLAKCEDIPLNDSKIYCKERVNEELSKKADAEEKLKQEENNKKIHQEAIESLDIDKCTQIKNDERRIATCKDSVYQTKASEENNKELCEKIQDELSKTTCLSNF